MLSAPRETFKKSNQLLQVPPQTLPEAHRVAITTGIATGLLFPALVKKKSATKSKFAINLAREISNDDS